MSLRALNAIALREQNHRMACTRMHSEFQTCSLRSPGSFGTVFAVIDPDGRTVLIGWRPDLHSVRTLGDMRAGLLVETRRLRTHWNRVASHRDSIMEAAHIESWMSGDGRWSGRIVWRADGYPSEFRSADERAVREWLAVEARAQSGALARGLPRRERSVSDD